MMRGRRLRQDDQGRTAVVFRGWVVAWLAAERSAKVTFCLHNLTQMCKTTIPQLGEAKTVRDHWRWPRQRSWFWERE